MRTREDEIDELEELIQNLTIDINTASEQLQRASERLRRIRNTTTTRDTNVNTPPTPTSTRTPTSSNRTRDRSLTPGDRVIITNNYKGNKGVIGMVERVTKALVWVRTDHSRELLQKRKNNISRIV